MADSKAVVFSATHCEGFIDPTTEVGVVRVQYDLCVTVNGNNPLNTGFDVVIFPTDTSAIIRQKMIDAIKAKALSEFSVTIENEDIVLPTYTTGLSTLASETRTDTFTTTGNGVTIDTSLRPLSVFSITVEGRSGDLTSWDIRLEGSLDGINWTTILQHTQVDGENITKYSGSNRNPCLFFRSRCSGLVLGTAIAAKVTILGVP